MNSYSKVKEHEIQLPIANGQSTVPPPLAPFRLFTNGKRFVLPLLTSTALMHGINPVTRIMRKALPDDAKISKEAKECMQKCVGEFISFITSEVAEKAAEKVAKNDGYGTLEAISCDDILASVSDLGFDNYAEVLRKYMSHYGGVSDCARRKYVVDKPQQEPGLAQRNNNFQSEKDADYELDN